MDTNKVPFLPYPATIASNIFFPKSISLVLFAGRRVSGPTGQRVCHNHITHSRLREKVIDFSPVSCDVGRQMCGVIITRPLLLAPRPVRLRRSQWPLRAQQATADVAVAYPFMWNVEL